MHRLLAWLVWLLAAPAAPDFVLKIAHVNDMHAHLTGISREFASCGGGSDCYGGFPRVLASARKLISEDPEHTLWLNAGDNFQGSAYYTLFKSQVITDFLNPMNFDALTLGNHEFDSGVPETSKFLREVKSTFVCANVDTSQEPDMTNGTKLVPTTIIDKAGVKIGIVGYITTETKFTSSAGRVTFTEEVATVRKFAKELKSQGAQIVVALGHSGYIIDQNIARDVEEVDVVVGGHSHTFLYTGEPPDPDDKPMGPYPTIVHQESGKIVPVVQAFKYTKYLGYFTTHFDDNFKVLNSSGKPILLTPSLPEDPELNDILAKWKEKLKEKIPIDRVLTEIQSPMKMDDCRYEECEIGNLITDAIVEIACEDYPACIGLYNGGAVRNGIKKGNLSSVELLDTIPFGNNLVVVQMDGAYLLEMLETCVNFYDVKRLWPKGGFLQVSGLQVVYDVSQPPGSRVVAAKARSPNPDKYEDVVPGVPYNIVTSSYVYNGGDNFTVFKKHDIKPSHVLNSTDFDAVSTVLLRHPKYKPKLEKRVQVINGGHPNGADSLSISSCQLMISLSLTSVIIMNYVDFGVR